MGRISSDTGLTTGVNITDMVDKLMAIEAKPRDRLTADIKTLSTEQSADTELTALLLTVQYLAKNLAKTSLYDQRSVVVSNTNAISATVTGSPALGAYQFTPVRMVQNQQVVSSGFASKTDASAAARSPSAMAIRSNAAPI